MAIQRFIVNGDEANIDYEGLINKPFGDVTLTGVIPETIDTNFSYNSSYGAYVSSHMQVNPFPNIILGKKYRVVYDNEEYECIAFYEESNKLACIILGCSITSPAYNYPFSFIFIKSYAMMVIAAQNTETTHTYKIEEMNYTTINSDYLPEYLRYGEDIQIITDQDYTISNAQAQS